MTKYLKIKPNAYKRRDNQIYVTLILFVAALLISIVFVTGGIL